MVQQFQYPFVDLQPSVCDNFKTFKTFKILYTGFRSDKFTLAINKRHHFLKKYQIKQQKRNTN